MRCRLAFALACLAGCTQQNSPSDPIVTEAIWRADVASTTIQGDSGAAAANYLESFAADLGQSAEDDWVVLSVLHGSDTLQHVRLQQVHRGVPVLGSEIAVHADETTFLFYAGRVTRNLEGFEVEPEVTGVDVSPAAVQSARQAFGNHFVLEGDPAIEAGAPYDVIYHVGTIGCVADPLGLTRRLLSLLKPGGALLFNSPNRDSCWLSDQLWVDGAPPPDLVSIFPPGFWARQFSAEANVEEEIESCASDTALKIGLGKLFGRRWKAPVPVPLNQTSDHYQNGNRPGRPDDSSWRAFENLILRVGRRTGLSRLAPSQPAEFGVFVKMVRK